MQGKWAYANSVAPVQDPPKKSLRALSVQFEGVLGVARQISPSVIWLLICREYGFSTNIKPQYRLQCTLGTPEREAPFLGNHILGRANL